MDRKDPELQWQTRLQRGRAPLDTAAVPVHNGTVIPPDPQEVGALHARQVLRATEQAMGRAAVAVHEDLKQGLNTLATLTCVAPLLGILGTVRGIAADTFLGLGTEKSAGMGAVAERISVACVPTALGLFVGLHSLWCYRYLQERLTGFDREMENESLRLVNELQRFSLRRVGPAAPAESISDSLPFLEKYSAVASADRRRWRRATLSATVLLSLVWAIELACYLDFDSLPPGAAVLAAFRSVLIVSFRQACIVLRLVRFASRIRRSPELLGSFSAVVTRGLGRSIIHYIAVEERVCAKLPICCGQSY
jgi:hypothetical protein